MINYFGILTFSLLSCLLSVPSIRLAVNQKNLHDIEKIIIKDYLIGFSMDVKPFDIIQYIDLFGTVEFNVTYPKVTISNANNNSISLTFSNYTNQSYDDELNYINLNVSEIDSIISMRYKFDSNFYNSEAVCNISINNISANVNMTIFPILNMYEPYKKGPTTHLKDIHIPSLPSLSFDCEKVDNTIDDNESIIQNLFDSFMPIIEKKIKKDFLPLINNYIDNYMKYFYLQKSIILNGSTFTLNYAMNEYPIILSHQLNNSVLYELSVDSILSSDKDPSPFIRNESIAIPHVDIDEIGLDDDAVIVIVSKDFLDNVMYVLKNTNNLNLYARSNITYPIELEIGIFADIIPQLVQYYKSYTLPMDINLTCFDYPKIEFKEKKIQIDLYYIMDIIVNNSDTVALSSKTNIEAVFSIEINQGKIKMTFETIIFKDYKVLLSNIGEVDEDEIKDNFNEIIDLLIITINEVIGYVVERIKIPKIFGINVDKVDCQIGENYMKLGISPYLD